MIKTNLILIFLLLLLLCKHCNSQQNTNLESYIILCVKDSFTKGQKEAKTFYWIIPLDSLNSAKSIFYPLSFNSISKNQFVNCCNGISINPNVFTELDSNFNLGKQYFNDLDRLRLLVNENKKTLQVINKIWITRKKETISFSVTPITGYFCSCNYLNLDPLNPIYKSIIFIPKSNFKLNKEFWSSIKFNILTTMDFSDLKYDALK